MYRYPFLKCRYDLCKNIFPLVALKRRKEIDNAVFHDVPSLLLPILLDSLLQHRGAWHVFGLAVPGGPPVLLVLKALSPVTAGLVCSCELMHRPAA